MIYPKQSDVGRHVIYQGGHPDDRDEGVLTSFTETRAFVRYGKAIASQATSFHDLTWAHPKDDDVLGADAGAGEV